MTTTAVYEDTQATLERWRWCFRQGFLPQFSDELLIAAKYAIENYDARLMHGGTTQPPPLQCVQDWPCDAACLIAYMAWMSQKLETVGQVEEAFAQACFECDRRLGEPAACRYLLNFWDGDDEHIKNHLDIRRFVLEEVDRGLHERGIEWDNDTNSPAR